MSASGIDIDSVRRGIPATDACVYMNTGWSGPSPRCVVEAVKSRLELESYQGPTSRPVLESRIQLGLQARQAIASLLNASPAEISLTQNTTEGLNVVINGLEWRPGDEVVTCNLEHPSILVPCLSLARRKGVVLKVVELDGLHDAQAVLRRFEDAITPHTRLIAISHIAYCTGLRLPLRQINELAHKAGATVLVDGAQTAGHIALDMPALGCDYYAIPGHKWLLGPDGVGALYVRQDLIPGLQPAKIAGPGARKYSRLGDFEPETEAIRKFELTTTSGPLWAGLIEAVAFLQGIGIENVERRALGLASYGIEALQSIPKVRVHSPCGPDLGSGLVTFSMEGIDGNEATTQLWERGRIVARSVGFPEGGIRLSLDFFNTEAEIDGVVDLVKDMAESGLAPAKRAAVDIDKDF